MSIKDVREMTVNTIGKDILQALVQEMKLLPDVWQKLSQAKQDDVIDRLRARVEHNVRMAVHMLAAQGRTVVHGDLDQITIKDGVKAQIKFTSNAENLNELYGASGKAVLVVVAGEEEFTGGMDEVAGEPDQRAMDLGHEYHDNDGGGMNANNVVDAEFEEVKALPSPGDMAPSQEELDKAFEDGHMAAEQGLPESACPVLRGELCIEWVKGWKDWHEEYGVEPGSNQSKVTAIPRYRHPSDTSLTWTGRGRKPAWVAEWLVNGGTLEQLEVGHDDQQAA